ncbi:MAG: hypothetical protein H6502_05070 [Candidatus Woesearchaeota archaeon]|nr:MAG: hypothetical protein H6502_05070 [Candidatus Woesearchaeota archaeon]
MSTKIFVPDAECDSCFRILEKRLGKLHGLDGFKKGTNEITLLTDDPAIVKQAIHLITAAGFRASLDPFNRMSIRHRIKEFFSNKSKYLLERRMFLYTLYAFILLTALEVIAYPGLLSKIPNFMGTYGWWLFYLNVSVATLGAALWHVAAHKTTTTCMVGMMIGMTIGMQTGMMIGAVIGATNGFFIGSMAGMFLGVIGGVITGKSCGLMGVMEGMMAGVMGGTMGAMISVMMFSDHLLWFMPFYMIFNIIILWGLTFMLFEEVVEEKEVMRRAVDAETFLALIVIIATILGAIMLYGPTSALISF